MKIAGRRRDGALYLTMGGGLAVILKGTRVTRTLDESVVESMGPWESTPDDNAFKARQATKVALDLARVAVLDSFLLDKDEHGYGSYPRNSIPGVSKPPGPASSTRRADDKERAADVDAALARPARDADARPARDADARPAKDADARPAKDADARPAGDRARDEARFAAEDRRKAMDRRKAEREEGWTANSPEGRNTRRDIAGGLKKRLAKHAKALEYTKGRMAELHALAENLTDDELDLMLDREAALALGAAPGGLFVKKTPVALDDTPPEKKAVSETAVPKEEVLNLPPAEGEVAPDAPPNPFFPADDRKQRREKMRSKIEEKVKSQGKVGGLLGDAEVSDDDLFAMAKELGIDVDEVPDAVVLIDNATKFQTLLSSTTFAKHISLAGGEHPFQYCIDHVIPSMEDEGKAPDDPEAFCAWWKSEHGE